MIMTDFDTLLDLAYRQVVQVTVMALTSAAVMCWACRQRPHLAHVLGLMVLIKCWVPPIWSSHGGIFCWPPIGRAAARPLEPRRDEPRQVPPPTVVASVRPENENDKPGLTEAPPALMSAAPSERRDPRHFAEWLIAAWLLGSLSFIVAASFRWQRWRRGVSSATVPPTDHLKALVDDLAMRIGLRSAPPVVVTKSRQGPAVYGLFRPTIVVPLRLLLAGNAENLRMALGHEMIHIRRGDLYVSLLQFATLAVWWFHPLIWWLCRRLTQERERACDEELLAALRCSPSDYAQCLLDALRQRRREMVPVFPGMRAVDVTRQRIEHIMQSRRAACARTPCRYWLFAAVVLLVTLPGQRLNLAVSAEDTRQGNHSTQKPAPTTTSETPPSSPEKEDKAADEATEPDASQESDAQSTDRTDAGSRQREELEQALDGGIRFLKLAQREDGSWPDPQGYPGGVSSLCTLAFLKWGMKPDEHAVQAALDWLRKIKPSMTYSTSLQTLVFCAANLPDDRKLIERNVKWLTAKQKSEGPYAGAWGYPQAEGDNSNTAFAVWALYEADRLGVRDGNDVWRNTLKYWLKQQNTDGSWGYKPQLGGTGTMTSQGIFCVTAAAKVLRQDKLDEPTAKAIEKAAAWLTRRFSVQSSPGAHSVQQPWHLYYLLALAKAGRISGRSQFGDHHWSAEGTRVLLDLQRPDGSWRGTGHAENEPSLATSFALLFLLESRE